MYDHINGSNEMYLFVNGMFIAEYQHSANHLIITITAMGYIPKPTCSTWRGIFRPSKGGAIPCSTGYLLLLHHLNPGFRVLPYFEYDRY
jgi:hypothetical protein